MDRDDLMRLLACYEESTLAVQVDGMFMDDGNDTYDLEAVEEAVKDMEAELAELKKVIAWAKQAPKRQPVAAAK